MPSRELARQVGKVWGALLKDKVATVFGGAPLERHAHQLRARGGTAVVVGTAGRLRELEREGHLSFGALEAMVLDEADVLLDEKDQPDVAAFLARMNHDYQLVLCSATFDARVRRFAMDTMELPPTAPNFVTLGASSGGALTGNGLDGDGAAGGAVESATAEGGTVAAEVRHWCVAAKGAAVRAGVAGDLVAALRPRRCIVFAGTKAEVDAVAAVLSARLLGDTVASLHGDMPQALRARALATFRASSVGEDDGGGKDGGSGGAAACSRVLVATDVAARGLDVPGVDLVVQLGLPRLGGKAGTFDAGLYTHRVGRAGRVEARAAEVGAEVGAGAGDKGTSECHEPRAADAVLLFDTSAGEAALVEPLAAAAGVAITQRPAPSPAKVVAAAVARAVALADAVPDNLARAVAKELAAGRPAGQGAGAGIGAGAVARAVAALTGLRGMPSQRSLLTSEPGVVTLRVRAAPAPGATPGTTPGATPGATPGGTPGGTPDDTPSDSAGATSEATVAAGDAAAGLGPVTPSSVTKLVKGIGGRKLARVTLLPDGAAVFDLPQPKAAALLAAAAAEARAKGQGPGVGAGAVRLPGGWEMDAPSELPAIYGSGLGNV